MYSSETLTERRWPSLRLPARLLSEERLARTAARGERWAFETLFARYHRELYAYCRAILEEPEEAEDAVQNTMTLALRKLPNLERRTSLRGWLYRVAHNESISILRRRGAVPVDPVRLPEGTVPGADVIAHERERLRQLVADLRALPGRQRGALVMRELSDLSYPQISSAMETSEAGARQLVYEARESLRGAELGRELDCTAARRAISERDGRVLRGLRLRAHLRSCASCRDFQAAIERRRTDLAGLTPPLAPAAGSGLLASLLGRAGDGGTVGVQAGAGAATTSVVGGGGGAALGGIGVKAASIASALALGAGAVGISGGIKPPFRASGEQPAAAASTPETGAAPASTPRAKERHSMTASGMGTAAFRSPQGRDTPVQRGRRGGAPDGAAPAAAVSPHPSTNSNAASRPTPAPADPPAGQQPAPASGGSPPTSQSGGSPPPTPGASDGTPPVHEGGPASTGPPAPPAAGATSELVPDKPSPSPSSQRITANTKP